MTSEEIRAKRQVIDGRAQALAERAEAVQAQLDDIGAEHQGVCAQLRELQQQCPHSNGRTYQSGPESDTEECPDCGLHDTWTD